MAGVHGKVSAKAWWIRGMACGKQGTAADTAHMRFSQCSRILLPTLLLHWCFPLAPEEACHVATQTLLLSSCSAESGTQRQYCHVVVLPLFRLVRWDMRAPEGVVHCTTLCQSMSGPSVLEYSQAHAYGQKAAEVFSCIATSGAASGYRGSHHA